MPSNSEGLSLVLVEALIMGAKIISTDCPTWPGEILNDINSLSNNIIKALREYPTIEDEIIDKFRVEYSVQQYLSLCNIQKRKEND